MMKQMYLMPAESTDSETPHRKPNESGSTSRNSLVTVRNGHTDRATLKHTPASYPL